jgi:hypothetical protein
MGYEASRDGAGFSLYASSTASPVLSNKI